jgi:hypothetical protein
MKKKIQKKELIDAIIQASTFSNDNTIDINKSLLLIDIWKRKMTSSNIKFIHISNCNTDVPT